MPAPVRLELNINPVSVAGAADLAQEAEKLGFARIGIWDSPALYREPWVTLTVVAQRTREVPIGVNVTNPLTRHPVITASAAASLDEVAPGRVYIAIGTGDSGVYNAGYRASPTQRLGDYVRTVRALLQGGSAEFEGARVILRGPVGHDVPIYVAAHGAKSLRLAAQVGDGVIVGLGLTPQVISSAQEAMVQAAEAAGRDPSLLDVWWASGGVHVDERPGAAARNAGWIVLAPTHHLARFTLKGKFVPPEYEDAIRQLGEIYDISTHGSATPEQQREYDALAEELGVRDYLLERFLIAGTSAEVGVRFSALADAGANQFSLGTATGGIEQARAAAKVVASLTREAAGGVR